MIGYKKLGFYYKRYYYGQNKFFNHFSVYGSSVGAFARYNLNCKNRVRCKMNLSGQRQAYGTFKLFYDSQILQIKAGYYRVYVSVSTKCSWNTDYVRFLTKKNGSFELIYA